MNERANWEMSLRAVQTLYPAMNSGAIIHSNGLSITGAAQCCSGVLSTWVCACWGGTTIFPHFRYVGGGGLNVNIQNRTKIDEDNCGIPEGSLWAFFSTYGMEKKKRSKVRELSTNANSKKNKGDEKSDIFPFEGNDDSEHTEEELADDTVSDLCGFKSSLEVNCPRDLTKPRGYLLLGLKAGNRKKTPITTKTNFALFQGHDSETDFFSTDTEKERKFAAMTEEERDAVIKENEDADQEVEKLLMDEVERRQKQQQISKSSLHKGDQPLSFSGVKWLDELAVPEPPVIKCGVIKVNHSLLRHYFLNQSAFQVSCPDSNQPQFIPPSCKTSHLRKLQQQAYLINGGVSYFKLRVPIVIKTSLQEDQETTYNNRDHPITRSTISATTITPATRHFAIGYKYLSVIHNRSVDTMYTSRQDTWHQGAKFSAGRSAGYGMNLMWTTNEASGILLAVDGPLATISGGSTATKENNSGTRMRAKQEPGGLFGRLALVQYPGWYLRIDNNKDKSTTKYFTLEYEPPVYGGSGGAVHITSDGEMGGLAPQIIRQGKPQAPALLSVKVLPCFRTPESLLQAPARVAAAVQTACATWPNDDKRGDDKSSFVRRKDLLVDDALYDMVVLDEAIGITMTIVIQEPKLNKIVKKVVLSEELQPSANSQNIEREKNSDLKKHCESDKIEQYMYVPTVMSSATESSLRTHGKNMVIAPVLTQSIEFTQAKLVSLQQHLLYSSHQAGEDVYLSDIDNRHGNGMYFNSTLIGDLDCDKAKSDELFLPPSDETDAIIEVVYHGNSLNNDMSGFVKNVDESQSAAMKPRYHFPVNSRRALLHNLLGNVSEQGSLQSYSHVVEELGSQKNTPSTNGLLYNRLLYHPTLYSCTAVDRTTTGPPLSHIEFLHERIGDQTRLLLVGPTNAGKTFLLSHLWVKSREISRGETTRGTSFMHSGGAGQTEICVRVGNRLLKMSKEVSDTASESVTTKGSHISAYTRLFRGAPPTPNVKSALVASCFVTDLSGTAPSTLITSHASTSDIIALVFDYRDPYTLTQLLEKYIPHVCNGAPVAGVDFVFIGNHSDDPMATVGNFEVEQVIIKAKEIRKQRLLNLLKSKKPRVFESSSIDIGHSYSQVKGDESDLAQKREYEAKLCHKITILRERIRLKLHEEIHGTLNKHKGKKTI